MAAPSPVAQGNLESTPLAHVVMSVHVRHMSGTLAIWPEQGRGQDRILFKDGMVRAANVLEPSTDLTRALMPLFHRQGTPYAFYSEDLTGEGALTGHLDPLALVAASQRGGMRDEVVERVLDSLRGKLLRVKQGTDLARFGFIPLEKVFLETLRAGPVDVDSAIRVAPSQKVARRVLYVMTLASAIDAYEDELPGLSDSPPEPVPGTSAAPLPPPPRAPSMPSAAHAAASGPVLKPSGLSPEHSTLWDEAVTYASVIDGQNYFEMLEVPQSAGAEDIRTAYFTKVKKWHPDRLPTELTPIRDKVETIFGHLAEAERTLSDMDSRKDYLKAVQGGGGTPASDRQLSTVLTAAMEFQKVEVLMRRKDYTQAEQIVRSLIADVPDEPDYHGALAAILWRQRGTDAIDEATASIETALGMNPNHERSLMTKALIYLRQELPEEAMPLLEKVLDANPKNMDAERQLRVLRMRGGGKGRKSSKSSKAGKDKKGSGFLSGFFGSKKKKS